MIPIAVICTSIGSVAVVVYIFLIAILIYYRKEDFHSSFFKLFIALGISDILNRTFSGFFVFFALDGVFPSFFASNLTGFFPVFGLFGNDMFEIAQAFCHVLLSFNRFTAMKYPMQYEHMWTNRRVYLAIAGQSLLSFAIAGFLLFAPTSYIALGGNSYLQAIISVPFSQARLLTLFVVIALVTVVTFVLNMSSLYIYFRHRLQTKSQQHKSIDNELRLLLILFTIFLVYCLLTAYEINGVLAFFAPSLVSSPSLDTYRWINELVCDLNPFLLLTTSSLVRKRFVSTMFCNRFYKKKQVVVVSPLKPNYANTGGNFIAINGNLQPQIVEPIVNDKVVA